MERRCHKDSCESLKVISRFGRARRLFHLDFPHLNILIYCGGHEWMNRRSGTASSLPVRQVSRRGDLELIVFPALWSLRRIPPVAEVVVCVLVVQNGDKS